MHIRLKAKQNTGYYYRFWTSGTRTWYVVFKEYGACGVGAWEWCGRGVVNAVATPVV